jgi:hypothetical protein
MKPNPNKKLRQRHRLHLFNLNLNPSLFSFGSQNGAAVTSSSSASDKDGTVAIDERDGKKHAVIRDSSGKTLFDGDVSTGEAPCKNES